MSDLYNWTRSEPRRGGLMSPPMLSTESSVTPTIRFDKLAELVPEDQIMDLRRLVSNHSLQRRKLVTAGSYLRSLHEETQKLSNKVEQYLSFTLRSVTDGDDFISAIGNLLDRKPVNATSRDDGKRSPVERSSTLPKITGDIREQSIDVDMRSPDRANLVEDHEQGADLDPPVENVPLGRPNDKYDPSPQMIEAMDREFSPRRPGETEVGYDNRYNAHIRRIQNTQQSWMRAGYDIPPHETQDARDVPENNIPEGTRTATTSVRPPLPGRYHPDATGNVRYRSQMIMNLRESEATGLDARVQFDSASRPYQNDQEREIQPDDHYPTGPTGISAYRVTHGPPNNGLWNAEHYHYTVMIRRIRQLVHWKVGNYISAPTGSKQPKMGEPTKYSGSRNHDAFLQWLNQFLNWLRSHYYCGDEADYSRLNLLGNYLEGTAADWFAADVDNPDRMPVEPMKFIDAICAMHHCFVRTATANNAVTQYDKVEYSNSDGVEGFYYKLDKMASRMVERPNDYSFRLRLFEGLPAWMYDTLLERNILPEFCTLEDIRENARQIEELRIRARGPSKISNMTVDNPRASTKTPARRDNTQSSQGTNRAPNRMNRNNNSSQPNVKRNANRSQD